MTTPLKIALVGALGRMGKNTLRLIKEHQEIQLTGALERTVTEPNRDIGELAGFGPLGVLLTDQPEQAIKGAEVVIDFSAPAACTTLAPICAKHRAAYLVASTGLKPEDEQALDLAAKSTAVLKAANLSLGVNVLSFLAMQAAKLLGPQFDVEILEIHHRKKKDAPSGTALALADHIRQANQALQVCTSPRSSSTGRHKEELGVAALRGGDVSGDHTVFFLGEGERLELTHRATSPDVFAQGALWVSRWLAHQPPGRYTMSDALKKT